jgi:hypothetical protein
MRSLIRAALFLGALMCASPAQATLWYFSGCASGGAGTISSPFCLDPGGSGTRKSFEYLMDGTGNEAACGDTIFLCAGSTGGAGDCDGAGTETWNVQPHTDGGGALAFVSAAINCTTASPITVQPYCSGSNCETVTISGDSNNNGAYDSATEPAIFFDVRINGTAANGSGRTGYRFLGDPNGDIACTPTYAGAGNPAIPITCTGANLIIEKFAHNVFYFGYAVGESFVITGTEIRYNGAGNVGLTTANTNGYYGGVAGDGGFIDNNINAGCSSGCVGLTIDNQIDSYAMFIVSHLTGGLNATIQKNYLHHNGMILARYNGNCTNIDFENCTSPPGLIWFDQNVAHILHAIGNGHEGMNITYTKNVITDFWGGLGIENQLSNVLLEDNIFFALNDATMGVTQSPTGNYGKAGATISVSDNFLCDDTTVGDRCSTRNITIRRNRLGAEGECTTAGGFNCGNRAASTSYLMAVIKFAAHNSSPLNGGLVDATIEDNIIIHEQKNSGCDLQDTDDWAFMIASNDGVIVRNNTVFDNDCSFLIRDGTAAGNGGTGAVSHTITNNLVVQSHGYGIHAGNNNAEMIVLANAATSVVQFNDFHYGSDGTGTVVCKDNNGGQFCSGAPDVPLTCAQITADATLGLASGASNKCAQPAFTSTSGNEGTWNLHLNSGDTVAKDTGSPFNSQCATLDIDGMTRSGNGTACDIGADELAGGAPPPARRRVVVTSPP